MQFIVEGYPAYAYTGGRPFDARLPAIVFLHGAALDHSVWQWQSRYFAHHGFAVLAVDLPAHGRSPGAARTTVAAMAQWAAALVEAAGLESAHVVGHSLGALVALEMALAHRTRVAKLAVLGAAVPMPVGEAFLAAARDDSPAAFDMQATWGHARMSTLANSAVPGISLWNASRSLNARAQPGVQGADLSACHGYSPDPGGIRALAIQALVIAGSRDQMTPATAGMALAREIAGAKCIVVDAGHSMMSEAPRAIVRGLGEFLAPR